MSLLYPLGLLGLIGIPIVIIIYIIKNKYSEQVIPATYLWTLSEKFLKKKNPINKIAGLISLILQILSILFISFAVARPVFTLPNAANDYCFILDGSGSMNAVQDDKTRLELGKKKIAEVIEGSANGSAYTLIYMDNTAEVVFESLSSKDRALKLLDEVAPSFSIGAEAETLNKAQEYFNENPSVLNYLITDKDYENTQNLTVINVGESVENYAVTDVEYVYRDGNILVSGLAYSYKSNAELNVNVYFDGETEPAGKLNLTVNKLEGKGFEIECPDREFRSIKVAIENPDALIYDNECVIYNIKSDETYKTLVVGDKPFFMKAALTALGYSVDTVETSKYTGQPGYGLYVFDCYTPETLPESGAVWLINPDQSIKQAGFTVQGAVELSISETLKYTTSSASLAKTLIKGIPNENVYVKKYMKCGINRDFTTVLSHGGNPVVFAGVNDYGNREVVYAFDPHDSIIAMLGTFTVLNKNLMDFIFPQAVDKVNYYSGDVLTLNVPSNCSSIRLDTPMGNAVYLDTGNPLSEHVLSEVGTYTVTMQIGDGTRSFNIFSSLPEDERVTEVKEAEFIITGEAENGNRNGVYDNLLILFILIAIVFLADWAVYCYEQYQLR